MALYIHPENQELLWNIVDQNSFLTAMLSSQSPAQKQIWFKGIIETFYNMNKHKTLDKSQLNKLNKDTLAYMIQMVRAAPPLDSRFMLERNSRTVNSFIDKPPSNPITASANASAIATPPIVPDNRSELFNLQFQNRQREYETMLEKKAPAEVNFSEKIEDGVISNMDELIKRQLQEREEEFKLYAPPPISQGPTGTPISPLVPDKPNNVTMEFETDQPIKDEIETLKSQIKSLMDTVEKLAHEIGELKPRPVVIAEEPDPTNPIPNSNE
jgi:hypothetical protein